MMHQQPAMSGEMLTSESAMLGEAAAYVPVATPAFSYDDLFPALPNAPLPKQRPNYQPVPNSLRVGTSVQTQVFHVPHEELRLDNSDTFGEGESLRACQNIIKDTGAHIEISTSKDGSLTFVVTGKKNAMFDVRRKILTHFQMQASRQLSIPKDHHRWILGKAGQKVQELEKVTATKITVPTIMDASEIITITGTKEGIEKAEHEIRVCSEEQSRKGFERISVEKIYHPFIVGPNGETVAAITAETGARIHVPPVSTQKDEIVIAGEKEGVMAAKAHIESIYNDMKKKCQEVRVEVPKSQHKYVIGARGATIQEILKETGVSIEMPSHESPNDTITLRGPHDKLGLALSKVYERANSVKTSSISAPSWIHKFIIGRKGTNIKKLTEDYPKVHVEFTQLEERIRMDGPPEEVEAVQLLLANHVQELVNQLTYAELHTQPQFLKHVIGKQGANVNRLKDELGVGINIIETEGSTIIRIEGSHAGVAAAHKELGELVHKLENEREKDVFVDHRYFKILIGVKGERIKEIRDNYSNVQIIFPDQGQKRSIIKLKGPQDELERCEKHIHKIVKELAESAYVEQVPIFKQFHKFVIGKGGANLKKIRDETQTRIDLPAENDNSDMITVTGHKDKVEEAVKLIKAVQEEHANIETEEIMIPAKYHNSLIGAGGKLIHSIMEECGGVTIKFPSAESGSDKVTISGPAEDIAAAKEQLLAHANERELNSHTAQVRARPEHHKFLIGKNGVNIKKIRELTGARIVFPKETDEDKETIFIIGREEAVNEACVKLTEAINDIGNMSEGETTVAAHHHRHFVARRGEVLRKISDEFGGVQISFPRQGVTSEKVVLKGPSECIEAAKQRIAEIVDDLEAKVTIECVIPQRYHRTVMGPGGTKVQAITSEHDVSIKFPERDTAPAEAALPNGDAEHEVVGPNDIIRISGRPENCEAAKEALLQQVPITAEETVPFALHRFLAGQRRRDFMKQYDVHMLLPPVDDPSDQVKITGTPYNVEEAKKGLRELVVELEKEKEDRVLRSFELKLQVDPEFHSKLIGKGGSVIKKIRADFGVQISFPREESDTDQDIIVIQGYEEKANAARDAIMKIVDELNNQTRVDLEIDSRVHSRLIGARGRNVRRIMDEYQVDIKFPRGGGDPNVVTISGLENAVADARDHLLNLTEEYMQDVNDNDHRPPAPSLGNFSSSLGAEGAPVAAPGPRQEKGFVVKGAPWEQRAPDTASKQQFPSFGRVGPNPAAAPPAAASSSPWGPRR